MCVTCSIVVSRDKKETRPGKNAKPLNWKVREKGETVYFSKRDGIVDLKLSENSLIDNKPETIHKILYWEVKITENEVIKEQ